jgi:hypothetical protein
MQDLLIKNKMVIVVAVVMLTLTNIYLYVEKSKGTFDMDEDPLDLPEIESRDTVEFNRPFVVQPEYGGQSDSMYEKPFSPIRVPVQNYKSWNQDWEASRER